MMIRRRDGFTLVELLVVIAIIAILAAILFPIFAKAREKAQQTRCINNAKQMATAIALYEDDYQGGVLPLTVASGLAGNESKDPWDQYWVSLMDRYMKQVKKGKAGGQTSGQGEILVCPSAPLDQATQSSSWQGGKTYGYNPYLMKNTTQTMVKYPSLTLRLTEVGSYIGDPHSSDEDADPGYKGGSFWAPRPSEVFKGLNLWAPGWHNGANTVLWFDGHVSTLPWQRVMYSDTCNGQTQDVNTWCRLSPKDGSTAEG